MSNEEMENDNISNCICVEQSDSC